MPTTCAVRGCKSTHTQGGRERFYRLPWRDAILCRNWLLRAGFPADEVSGSNFAKFRNMRMCSLHFEGETRPTAGVFPSLNIPDFEQRNAAISLLTLGNSASVTHTEPSVTRATSCTDTISGTTDSIPSDVQEREAAANSLLLVNAATADMTKARPSVTTSESPPALSLSSANTTIHSDERRKRHLFIESPTQVTPKKRKTSSSQFSPRMQKSTQVTPKGRKSTKMNTDIGIDKQHQTEFPPAMFVLKKTVQSQTTSAVTVDKGIQVSVPKIHLFKSSDKELKKYTGIIDHKLFEILHKYLVSACNESDCNINHCENPKKVFAHIDTETKLLLVLYKLKRNPVDSVLSSEFGISIGRISEIFKYWIRLMFRKFKIIKIWPSKELVDKHMPETTKSHFPDLVAISDCVEFSTQVPRGPIASKQMFSHYKNCHTTKIMYTTAPNGALIHCSDMYGGNASDKEIFAQSDLAERLQSGDGLMVDKGFMIRDCIQGKGIQLYRPPFLSEKNKQFDPDDRDSGRLIARSRIIVENFNARISTYAFLKQKKIPLLYLPMMNEIGFVCGFLANLGPLIRRNQTAESAAHDTQEMSSTVEITQPI